MPIDPPIGFTDTLSLGLWAESANPGFAALNDNWTVIDTAIAALQAEDVTLQAAIDALTTSSTAALAAETAARVAADSAEATARAAGDAATLAAAEAYTDSHVGGFLKLDGSTTMTGDIDAGSHKVKNVADGTTGNDAVNYGQLQTAALSGFDAIHEAVFWMLMG